MLEEIGGLGSICEGNRQVIFQDGTEIGCIHTPEFAVKRWASGCVSRCCVLFQHVKLLKLSDSVN